MQVTVIQGEPVRVLAYSHAQYYHVIDVLGILGFNSTHRKYVPATVLNGDYLPEWAVFALLDFKPAIGPVITAILSKPR